MPAVWTRVCVEDAVFACIEFCMRAGVFGEVLLGGQTCRLGMSCERGGCGWDVSIWLGCFQE